MDSRQVCQSVCLSMLSEPSLKAEMEKAYKIALTKFEPEKFAHKIWAKYLQKCAKNSKNAKSCTTSKKQQHQIKHLQ